jgi:hypothetical protein
MAPLPADVQLDPAAALIEGVAGVFRDGLVSEPTLNCDDPLINAQDNWVIIVSQLS